MFREERYIQIKKELFVGGKLLNSFVNLVKGIDDRENSYDKIEERRELEKAAKMLFG